MRLGLLPVLLRETLASRQHPREPEPDLVMEGDEQVAAYASAGAIDGVLAGTYLFNSAGASQALAGCGTVVDLGCGPATQLAQVAQLNPGTQFIGVDLSPTMLAQARAHVERLGLPNVRFVQADISTLEPLGDASADGVMSTLALHHLPTRGHLERCFRQVARILRPGGALYLADLGRLKTLPSMLHFAWLHQDRQPHVFSLDFERSLRASFLREDFVALATKHLGPGVTVTTTRGIEVFHVVATAPRPLAPDLARQLQALRQGLPPHGRDDLADLRTFLRWGGLPADPFSA